VPNVCSTSVERVNKQPLTYPQQTASIRINQSRNLDVSQLPKSEEQHQKASAMEDSDIMAQNIQPYPLTNAQKNIWLAEQLFPGTSMNLIAATLRIKGAVDFKILEQALNLFIEKNESVRIRIREINGEPMQYVVPFVYHEFEYIDFMGDLNRLYDWDEKETRKPLPLLDSELFEFILIKPTDFDGGFYLKFHHLISDAWTMALLGNEVMAFYNALKNSEPVDPAAKPSFIDYLATFQEYMGSERFQRDQEYWDLKFTEHHAATTLKSKKNKDHSFKARRKTLLVPQKLSAKIHEYCREKKVSEFSLFLAAVSMYINRVTGKEDLVLGTTLLNRTNAREKETTGLFANIAVPLRFLIKDDMNFDTFVEIVSKEIVTVLRHQKYPYDLILKHVREEHKTAEGLFDLVVTYQNSKFVKDKGFEDFSTRWHFSGAQIESLIVNINDRENDGRLIIDYDYLTDLFYATEIEFVHQHIINLLWHALDNPAKMIAKLEMLSEKEKYKILRRFNDTRADFPRDKTLPQLFAEQVRRTPDRTAAVFGRQSLTYREMDEKTSRLAALLRTKGVRPDTIVGIMLDRSLEMIIGILGILKAGGAYLPVDPNGPADRLRYMLQDCGAKILLTDRQPAVGATAGVDVIDLRDDHLDLPAAAPLAPVNSPGDLAYVIYTSGSTGQPKGVMIEQRSLVNRICWMQKKYPLDEDSVILQKTPYTFDVSVWELVWWFFAGASVCLLEPGGEKDPAAICAAIARHRITTIHFVPSMLNMFLHFLENGANSARNVRDLVSLKQVFASGETLGLAQAELFNHLLYTTNGTALANLYGPTEAAIDVSYFDCSPNAALKSVPIGKPIDNTSLYILDKNLNLLPIGIPGELYIGGVGLARGYVNKPDLTAERFLPNPFIPGERIYKTGDLVRWYAEGDIEFLGRLDHQVKIRGFRIELGEIENRLMAFPGIREAVVNGVEARDKKYLCAYYVGTRRIAVRELRKFLEETLPEYMIPSYFLQMDALPLTTSGKISRQALPLPAADDGRARYAPPVGDVEKILVKAFQDTLAIKEIGIDDSLFDLGGDSLSVMQIYTTIFDYDWGLSAADFYEFRTIRELAAKVGGQVRHDSGAPAQDFGVIEPKADASDNLEAYPMHHVFLTGATGFLGAHLLDNLLTGTAGTVYCLVRGPSGEAAADRLRQTLAFYFDGRHTELIGQRIVVLQGDIEDSQFGLGQAAYTQLGNTVDTVIHAAAIVKYFGDYAQVESVNVLGTQAVIDFALRFNLKLNHISTDAVTGNFLVNNAVQGNYTENDFYVGQNFQGNIYVRSKFEAENRVLLSIRQGLKATIYRMGNLTGRYSDGHFQRNIADNAFYGALRSVLALGVVSDELREQPIEFSPVDLAADAIIRIARTRNSDNRVFHVLNHHTLLMKDLVQLLIDIGSQIRTVSRDEMNRYLENEVDAAARQEYLPGLMVYLNKTGELAFANSLKISSDISVDYLQKLGFSWPSADQDYLRKLVGYMQKTGYLKG
jgi:amino acid adenylation domain-containing protein/thioester reductase-like protein